jgi:hypothetical protein
MNLKNIARDAYWINDLTAQVAFSGSANDMANDGTVHEDVADVVSNGTSGASGLYGVGVFMKPPLEDNVPYRVKAYCDDPDNIYLILGYAPASITGNDVLLEQRRFHLAYEFDEILMLPKHATTDTYYNRAIGFGIFSNSVATNHLRLCVQKLDVAPPQFSFAVP